MLSKELAPSYAALRIAYGVVPVVAGLDKFFNLLTDWERYLAPLALQLLPVSATTFMHLVGIVEIAAGIAVLVPRLTRVGAYVVCVWLACIGVNLLMTGRYWDIAVRDFVMSVGAFSLARQEEARRHAEDRARATGALRPAHA